jgi:type I restriction enzyme S subunit
MSYKRLGDYIQPVNIRNKELEVTTLLGVSIRKVLMPSIANTIGTNMKTYKIIKQNQFAYGPVTSRNGDKISIALLEEHEIAIVSQAYTVFEVIDEQEVLPEYLMMWFRRPEFDRFARFKSHGSAREVFDWEELCDTQLPIPSIEKQRQIVAEYNTVTNRINLNSQLNQNLEDTAQALYKHWFVDFEFPNTENKPYKSSGGEMVYNEELDKDIPVGWSLERLETLSEKITKGTTPQKMYSSKSEDRCMYIKGQSIGSNHFVDINKVDFIEEELNNQELKRSVIFDNDILFTITGTLGEFAIVDSKITPANTNQNVAIIRLKEALKIHNYITFLFIGNWHREFLIENRQEAVQANLNLTMIANMNIILPNNWLMDEILKISGVLINEKKYYHYQSQTLQELQSLLLAKMAQKETKAQVI